MGLLVRTINRLLKGFDDSLTRQREAERKVSEREAFIRGIMDNVPDGILTINEKGLAESCNSSAENLFGYKADELAGFSPDQLINEPERSLLYDIIDSYLKSGDSEKLKQAPSEASALRRNSTSFPLEIRLNEMHLRERRIIICVLSDISERKQNEYLKTENLRMSTELDITRRLQQMILPTPDELQQIEGLDIVGYMKPAAEVGGDYYDVLRHNGAVKIGIGDVTGHGLESGVLMLMTQTAVRTLLTSGEEDPARFLDILNRTLYDNVRRMKADKSLTLALLDYKEGQLKLSGQHEHMIVVRKGGQVELVDTIDLGFPIALDDNIIDFVDEATVTLKTGDGVVLYTDGITEAENMAGEFYGLKRLCSIISRAWEGSSTEEVKQAVIDDVKEYIGKQEVYDDLTLVVLKQK
ncbi:MAG: SpoIIE family protein phosphatase [Desulfobacterales bacterium]|nr:SpoIIE family protein phosphatase [Desulfobacterales bacterium]